MDPSIAETACPEKQLLICCARVDVQADIAEKIRDLASGPLDWDYLFSEAADNALIPLLHLQLTAVAADKVPTVQMDRLKAAVLQNTRAVSIFNSGIDQSNGRASLARYCGDPVQRTGACGAGVWRHCASPIRGSGHNCSAIRFASGERSCCWAWDIAPKFPWILSADAAASFVPGDYIYINDERQAMIELHTERSMRHFPVAPELKDLAAHLVPVSLSGHEIETFCAEDALAILCVHGSKHFWEKLSWIVDISEMVRSHPGLDWNKVLPTSRITSRTEDVERWAGARRGFAWTALPEEISARVKGDRVAVELASGIERRLLSRELSPLGAAAALPIRRQIVPGAVAGWRYALRLATAPSEEDWEMVRLPAALAPLYIALRPIRLLRKYGGKALSLSVVGWLIFSRPGQN